MSGSATSTSARTSSSTIRPSSVCFGTSRHHSRVHSTSHSPTVTAISSPPPVRASETPTRDSLATKPRGLLAALACGREWSRHRGLGFGSRQGGIVVTCGQRSRSVSILCMALTVGVTVVASRGPNSRDRWSCRQPFGHASTGPGFHIGSTTQLVSMNRLPNRSAIDSLPTSCRLFGGQQIDQRRFSAVHPGVSSASTARVLSTRWSS